MALRSRVRARPALPDRRVSARRRGRVCSESRECCAKGGLFSSLVDATRIMGKGDTRIHIEAWWAVANEIPPISMRPEQPSRCVRVCSGSDLRHVCSLAQPASNQRTLTPPTGNRHCELFCSSSAREVPIREAGSQSAAPGNSSNRSLTTTRTTASGRGTATVNRIVPFDSSNPGSRSRTASTTRELNGKTLR